MSDVELYALAVLVITEVESAKAENMQRAHLGQSMAYDNISSPTIDRLEAELKRRGILA